MALPASAHRAPLDEWLTAREVATRAGITPAAARQRLLRAGISWRRGDGRGGPKLYRARDVEDLVFRPDGTYAQWHPPKCAVCAARLESCVAAYRVQTRRFRGDYPGGAFPGGQWRELSPPDCAACGLRVAITYTLNDSGMESVTWRNVSPD